MNEANSAQRPSPWPRLRGWAQAVATLSLGTVFVLFLYGIGMRHLFDRPISWVDEAVTVLSVWSVLWTAAFVLRWREHIAFDVLFIHVAPPRQRLMLLVGNVALAALFIAALPGMVDYTLFLWRERTDMLGMRLDFVYAIFPLFFIAVVLRQLVAIWHLAHAHWRASLDEWGAPPEEAQP